MGKSLSDLVAREAIVQPAAQIEVELVVVTAGRAWVQIEGEQVRALGPGEVVWTPPGAKHWHGATRSSSMTHVGVSEREEGGGSVTWLEPVSDAQYQGPQ